MRSNPDRDIYASKIIKENGHVDMDKINANIVKGKGFNIPRSALASIIFSSVFIIGFILWAFEIVKF